ncbi:MAG: HTH domain-containing protein [Solirubrobacteraceae bacterium]|nr:HTH domain-containing protein [Solirubrobacteraceae bacterium]
MSKPAARVLTMLEMLQDRPGVGGAELADELGVDLRTVRRYAVTLRELGMPVEAQRGRAGGYRLRPGFKPPLTERNGWRHEIDVLLHTNLDAVRWRVPAASAELREEPYGVRLRATMDSLDSASAFLAGLGVDFTIAKPDALRGAVARRAERLHAAAARRPACQPSTLAMPARS